MKCFVKRNKKILFFVVALTVVSGVTVYASQTYLSDSEIAQVRAGCDCGEMYSTTECDDRPCGPSYFGRIKLLDHIDSRGCSPPTHVFEVTYPYCYQESEWSQQQCAPGDLVAIGMAIECSF